MTALEKTEQQLEKANAELDIVREKKADILEKEKAAVRRVEELENQRILQIVGSYNLGGNELKKKLAAIVATNRPENKLFKVNSNEERNNENEKSN